MATRTVRWCCVMAGLLPALTIGAPSRQAMPPKVEKQGRVDVKEREYAEKAVVRLRNSWTNYVKSLKRLQAARPPRAVSSQAFLAPDVEKRLEASLPLPQRQSLARASTAQYVEPEVLRSKNKALHVTLDMAYANNHIGKDRVHLRAFNGKLVGPTLHLKPGDTLYLTLNNTMAGERWQPNMMNTINSFNTTNLHYHGLHVSPNGNSDNVLIQVGPKETQYYKVEIPKDHTPGTYWYHPHRHGSTAGDVASGMSGALIIEGGLDDIPQIKAMKDRVMVLNQIPYIFPPIPSTIARKPVGVVEAQYADLIFGPNSWKQLGRYTTINGVQLPVLHMRPGEIERWRFVDSGQRETIHLRLIHKPTPSQIAQLPMNMYEIADDGLALGKMVKSSMIELWPGYRSDVLVQAPPRSGEYLLINDQAAAGESIDGSAQPLTYVARVIVAGAPNTMRLPRDQQMAHLRLPSIKNSEITGHQEAHYGIFSKPGGGVVFTIDGKSFEMETARELKLGDVDEWTLRSINGEDIGLVTHPFHIHVNPFEVTSIMAPVTLPDGTTVLKEQLQHGRVWRDTVKIPGGGYVKMRTRYTDFIGTFVQHCHILDHEDQGMMQLIDIIDPKAAVSTTAALAIPKVNSLAPDFTLPDAAGKPTSLAACAGKPVVLFFFKGHGCLHCSQQVALYAEHYAEFQRKGIQVIGVTSDDPAVLKTALASSPCPFPILADPKGTAFAKFGCVDVVGLQHGTFALDAKHNVVWRTVSDSPYLIVTDLLKTLQTDTVATNRSSVQTPSTLARIQ